MKLILGQRVDIIYPDNLGRTSQAECYVVKINKNSYELKNIHMGYSYKIQIKNSIFTPAKTEEIK
jgi:hypothetical protein